MNEVEGQLKKLAITASNRKDHMFLSINTNRQGFISKENLRDLVSHHHLPADPDIIDGVRTPSSTHTSGAIHVLRNVFYCKFDTPHTFVSLICDDPHPPFGVLSQFVLID